VRLGACTRLDFSPIRDVTWYRAVRAPFWAKALDTRHTARVATRFNAGSPTKPSFRILYLAESPLVALYEVSAVLGPPGQHLANPKRSDFPTFGVVTRLQAVADLTDAAQQSLLDISLQELTGNWDTYPLGEAPTQILGAALFGTPGLEGFLTFSAKFPTHKNLVVFPQKLLTGSLLHFDDIITRKRHVIRPPRTR
jgi:RES domain-containing protein